MIVEEILDGATARVVRANLFARGVKKHREETKRGQDQLVTYMTN